MEQEKAWILASNNCKKIEEYETLLSALSSKIRIEPISSLHLDTEAEENGTSFAENSLIKALVPAQLGYVGMADDSGLAVDALDGAPGIYSARFAGEHGDDAANRALLLAKLANTPQSARGAVFVCVITIVFPEEYGYTVPAPYRLPTSLAEKYGVKPEHVLSVRGESRGWITREEIGDNGFGYDSLFLCPEYEKTFAQLTAQEKNSISHRGRAMLRLQTALSGMKWKTEVKDTEIWRKNEQ